MATEQQTSQLERRGVQLSLDWWSVLIGLVLALLVLVGAIPNVGW